MPQGGFRSDAILVFPFTMRARRECYFHSGPEVIPSLCRCQLRVCLTISPSSLRGFHLPEAVRQVLRNGRRHRLVCPPGISSSACRSPSESTDHLISTLSHRACYAGRGLDRARSVPSPGVLTVPAADPKKTKYHLDDSEGLVAGQLTNNWSSLQSPTRLRCESFMSSPEWVSSLGNHPREAVHGPSCLPCGRRHPWLVASSWREPATLRDNKLQVRMPHTYLLLLAGTSSHCFKPERQFAV